MKCKLCNSTKLMARQHLSSFADNDNFYHQVNINENLKWVSENPILKSYNSTPCYIYCLECNSSIEKDYKIDEFVVPKITQTEIVLDLDHTLFLVSYHHESEAPVYEDYYKTCIHKFTIDKVIYYVFPRPYLKEFIEYCENNFKKINIYTSATAEYAKELVSLLNISTDKLGFVKSRKDTFVDRSFKEFERQYLKKIDNALIIDDNNLVYSGYNNIIYKIPKFYDFTIENDTALFDFIQCHKNSAEIILKMPDSFDVNLFGHQEQKIVFSNLTIDDVNCIMDIIELNNVVLIKNFYNPYKRFTYQDNNGKIMCSYLSHDEYKKIYKLFKNKITSKKLLKSQFNISKKN